MKQDSAFTKERPSIRCGIAGNGTAALIHPRPEHWTFREALRTRPAGKPGQRTSRTTKDSFGADFCNF